MATHDIQWTFEELPADVASRTPDPNSKLSGGFGNNFADRMLTLRWNETDGWHDGRIGPMHPLSLSPAALVLHYAQEIFEGLKAYQQPDGEIALFRPAENAKRFNLSAQRLCMPELPEAIFLDGIERLVDLERAWVPSEPGSSLYIRPVMIADEAAVGVRSSRTFLYYVILAPVPEYFSSGKKHVRILIEEDTVRAAPGGTGAAKTAANYAQSLAATKKAKAAGCDQVLFLDAAQRRFVEELGGMNVFFVVGGTVVTPPLGGTILPGITRDSCLQVLRAAGRTVEERNVSIGEVIERIKSGEVTEAFAVGTAAVVAPIGSLVTGYGSEFVLGEGGVGPVAADLKKTLVGIQRGTAEDPYGWRKIVPRV